PGQRLVSVEGDLWRWDGFSTAAEAPTPAARRLAEKNRLADLEKEAAEARRAADAMRQELEAALAAVRAASQAEHATNEEARRSRQNLDAARQRLAQAERRRNEVASRLSALTEAKSRVDASRAEAEGRLAGMRESAAEFVVSDGLEQELAETRTRVADARVAASEARATHQGLKREADMRARRRETIAAESRSWTERREKASGQIAEFENRIQAAVQERESLDALPGEIILKRRTLVAEIETAEAARKDAADKLAEAETTLAAADRAARESLALLSQTREARARTEARVDAANTRLADTIRAIADALESTPEQLPELAGLAPGDEPPASADVERRLHNLKAERERIGAVNLRADDELTDIEGKKETLIAEQSDLVEAIKKLRAAIQNLNKEGRERLLASFETVNQHFQQLFTTLFGGGTAELQLIESDDPLEAGLEIIAKPPGKKPQTMTLLSGGEQALTATALIFAVFLTNPSPICVLDEVDAPLDDANVERYCDLLDDMAKRTETRFVVITHNPITMARMNRLFGVTMAEKGVSQLVSVDLEQAERVLEAG
ncbi:MAG: chromosome segregation protein SMC, partial [Beijerinckiaceae bacterium]